MGHGEVTIDQDERATRSTKRDCRLYRSIGFAMRPMPLTTQSGLTKEKNRMIWPGSFWSYHYQHRRHLQLSALAPWRRNDRTARGRHNSASSTNNIERQVSKTIAPRGTVSWVRNFIDLDSIESFFWLVLKPVLHPGLLSYPWSAFSEWRLALSLRVKVFEQPSTVQRCSLVWLCVFE